MTKNLRAVISDSLLCIFFHNFLSAEGYMMLPHQMYFVPEKVALPVPNCERALTSNGQ